MNNLKILFILKKKYRIMKLKTQSLLKNLKEKLLKDGKKLKLN